MPPRGHHFQAVGVVRRRGRDPGRANPPVRTPDNRIVLDGKVTLTPTPTSGQPGDLEFNDREDSHPLQLKANKYDLNCRVKLDGAVGIINGAGPADDDAERPGCRREARRGQAGKLPRPRRRLHGGDGRRAGRDPGRPSGQERVRERLRRHHRMRAVHRIVKALKSSGDRRRTKQWWSAARRQQVDEGQARLLLSQSPTGNAVRHHGRGPSEPSRDAERKGNGAHGNLFVQGQGHRSQGITGEAEATVHTARTLKAGTQIAVGVNALQGRHHRSPQWKTRVGGHPSCRRSAALLRRWKTGRRRAHCVGRSKIGEERATIQAIHGGDIRPLVVITEGIPADASAYVVEGYNLEKVDNRIHRPTLPGHQHGPSGAGRHHPGQHHRTWFSSGWCPVGHADLSRSTTSWPDFRVHHVIWDIGGDPVIDTMDIDAIKGVQKDPHQPS